MNHALSRIVDDYDQGRLTRRQLLAHLAALFTFVGGGGQAHGADTFREESSSTFEATEINHIALRVTDVGRSRDFYVKHLGMRVTRDSADAAFLTCGENFVALFRGEEPGLDHYCYSVKNYNVRTAEEKLRAAEMKNIRRTSGRIYFDDADGITVQLAAEDHQ